MPETTAPRPVVFVRLVITFLDDSAEYLDCDPEIGANYLTIPGTAFANGLLAADNWFIKVDRNGKVHAFRLAHVKSITAKLVEETPDVTG